MTWEYRDGVEIQVGRKKTGSSKPTKGLPTKSKTVEGMGAERRNPGGIELFEQACGQHQAGDLARAEKLYRQALSTNPELVDGWRNLGAMLRKQGKVDEGLRCTEEALKRRPTDQSLWGNAGNALRDLGRLEESKRAFEKAMLLEPKELGPLLGLAITMNKGGEYWPLIHRILPKLDALPENSGSNGADLLLEVGNAYHHLGDSKEALKHWQRALHYAKGEKQLLMVLNTAQVLCETQRHADAAVMIEKQIEYNPESANLHYALGVAIKGMGRWEEACKKFDQALELDPNYAICLNTYGLLLRDIGRSHQARECFERALVVDPEFGAAMNNLGSVLKDVARYPEALEWLKKGAAKLADKPAAQSNVLFTMVGYELGTVEERFAEAAKFAQQYATSPFERWRDRIPTPDKDKQLKVGLLSPDFCRHAVSYFIEPLLEQWDREELHITLYGCGNVRDDYTRRLQSKAERWRDLDGINDEAASLQILRDEIDILIDIAGHTAGNRLQLMAAKPAPIQATYLGYYGTTGLKQIDYWLTDNALHPMGCDSQDPCTEERWRLARAYVSYRPLPEAPDVGELPMLKRGYPMLGSFNQSRKITSTTAERWMAVLNAIPDAKLLLKSKNLGEQSEAERIKKLFSGLGLEENRLHLAGHSPSVAAHLACYLEIDLALDTFPYTGCTTTADALWMGVPVLTVAGKSMVSRQAAAVLSAVGCNEWISNNTDELVGKAKNLIGDKNKLKLIRQGLRDKIRGSELMDHKGLADELGKSFRDWWLRWLQKEGWIKDRENSKFNAWPERLPPSSIAMSCPYPR